MISQSYQVTAITAVLIADGVAVCVGGIEDNGDGGRGDSGLNLLVHYLLQVRRPHLLRIGDSEH